METKDIMNYISTVTLASGISENTQREYSFLKIKFVNGYETAFFPGRNSDAMYIIKNVIVKE